MNVLHSAGVFVHRKRVMTGVSKTARIAGTPVAIAGTNRSWVSGIADFSVRGGRLYLAVTMDVYSRRIIGWSVARKRSPRVVLEALQSALRFRRPDRAFVYHSDGATKYATADYADALIRSGGLAGARKKQRGSENIVVRSFFGTLKTELDQVAFRTADEARLVIAEYVDGWYNPTRRHSAIGYASPIGFEEQRRSR
jgi:transposase InsO family protein